MINRKTLDQDQGYPTQDQNQNQTFFFFFWKNIFHGIVENPIFYQEIILNVFWKLSSEKLQHFWFLVVEYWYYTR